MSYKLFVSLRVIEDANMHSLLNKTPVISFDIFIFLQYMVCFKQKRNKRSFSGLYSCI